MVTTQEYHIFLPIMLQHPFHNRDGIFSPVKIDTIAYRPSSGSIYYYKRMDLGSCFSGKRKLCLDYTKIFSLVGILAGNLGIFSFRQIDY